MKFYTDPNTAHSLTAIKKKQGFFFRTLTRTDHIERVYCETDEKGRKYIINNKINFTEY